MSVLSRREARGGGRGGEGEEEDGHGLHNNIVIKNILDLHDYIHLNQLFVTLLAAQTAGSSSQ